MLFYTTSCVWLRSQTGGRAEPTHPVTLGPGTLPTPPTTGPAAAGSLNWFAGRPQRVVSAAGTDPLEADVPVTPVPRLFTAPVMMHWKSLSQTLAERPSQFWVNRLAKRFDTAVTGPVRKRFEASDEECCAVLAVADGLDGSARSRVVIVPAGASGGWARVYRLDIAPGGPKPRLEVQFVAEVDDHRVVDLDAQSPPSTGNTVVPTFIIDFPPDKEPSGKAVAPVYFRLYDLFAASPAGPVARVVRFRDADGKTGQWVVGADNQPGVATQRLTLINLGDAPVAVASPPAGYAARQWADPVEAGDGRPPLRHVGGLDRIPESHRAIVRATIRQYLYQKPPFGTVRVAVPMSPTRRLLMSFAMQPTPDGHGMDVVVTGTSTDDWILRGGSDRERMIAYFVRHLGDDVAAIRRRWDAVHPASRLPAGPTDLAATRVQISTLLRGVDPVWLANNYSVYVDDPEVMNARLTRLPNGGEYVDACKAMTPDEMLLLELVLQQFGTPARAAVRGVHVGRCRDVGPGGETSKQAGVTLSYGVARALESTVLIFDAAYENADYTFTGDLGTTVWPITAHTMAHEMGHVVANRMQAADGFNRRFIEGNKAFTWYAESKPDSELFPEVFATFVLCPDWLRFNAPALFDAIRPFADTAGP